MITKARMAAFYQGEVHVEQGRITWSRRQERIDQKAATGGRRQQFH